ncbi:hypothetical protein CHL67_08785 [Prosthecochloris sp. GSB1]|uniref:DUF3793 family protein n=1 Tax=Prosthecochloris sp. GSB1 TaxID=281093 RepID=UPI000B8CE590|nr:DUF3793 family protein [Prosthecochloris sp. GSB1]ASQ91000.1 hypothetical protein CHL67_08785 [Prosthecochloris sp. GSB1]
MTNKNVSNHHCPVFAEWKKKLVAEDCSGNAFERWLFVQAAGVLYGGKTGELLIVKKEFFPLTEELCRSIIDSFCSSWGLDYKVLVVTSHSLKLIVYSESAVNRRLKRASKKFLHCYLRYPFGLDAVRFLEEVGCRWEETGRIPHEIGIALGYPLKDVWGFMGFRSFRCSGSCGWQIFGDPEPSVRIRSRYEDARRKAEYLLKAA